MPDVRTNEVCRIEFVRRTQVHGHSIRPTGPLVSRDVRAAGGETVVGNAGNTNAPTAVAFRARGIFVLNFRQIKKPTRPCRTTGNVLLRRGGFHSVRAHDPRPYDVNEYWACYRRSAEKARLFISSRFQPKIIRPELLTSRAATAYLPAKCSVLRDACKCRTRYFASPGIFIPPRARHRPYVYCPTVRETADYAEASETGGAPFYIAATSRLPIVH